MAAVQISNTDWGYQVGRRGPFKDGSNNIWLILPVSIGGSSYQLAAFRSTDSGASFSQVGSTCTATQNSTGYTSFDVVFDSANGIFYVGLASGYVEVWKFTISNSTWAAVWDGSSARPAPYPDSNGHSVVLLSRRSDGSFIVFYQGSLHAMGNDFHATYYSPLSSAGVWGTAVAVGSLKGTNYDAKWTVLGTSDRVHFFYTDGTNLVHRSLSSGNALDTAGPTATHYTLGNALFLAAYYDATLGKVVVENLDTAANGGVALRATSGGASPQTWTEDTNRFGTSRYLDSSSAFIYDPTGGKLYVFFADSTSYDLYYNSTSSTTWTTANAAQLDATTAVKGISAGLITDAIGVVYNDNGTVYFDKYSLAAGPAQKSSSDQNSTTTEIATPSYAPSVTDQNGTTTEDASARVPKSATDQNSTTTEAATFAYSQATPDNNSTVTEATTLAAKPQTTDQNGAVTEDFIIKLGVTVDVNGTVTEDASVSAPPVPKSDSDQNSTTTETAAPAYAPSVTDNNGTVTETAAPTYQPSVTDQNGAVTEIAAPSVPVAGVDQNSVTTEAQTLVAKPIASDGNGTTTESASVTVAQITATDANGVTAEAVSVLTAQITALDANGTTTESATAGVAPITVTDANGTVIEAASVGIAQLSTADTNGVPVEAASVTTAQITASDANGTTVENAGTSVAGMQISDSDVNGAVIENAQTAFSQQTSDVNGTITEIAAPSYLPQVTDVNSTTTETAAPSYQAAPAADGSGVTTESAFVKITVSDQNAAWQEDFVILLSASDVNSVTTEAATSVVAVTASDVNSTVTEAVPKIGIATSDQNSVVTEIIGPRKIVQTDSNAGFTEFATSGTLKSSADVNSVTTEAATPVVQASTSDANGAVTEAATYRYVLTATDSNVSFTEITDVHQYKLATDVNSTTTEAASTAAPISASDANGATAELGAARVFLTAQDASQSVTEAVGMAARITDAEANGTATEDATLYFAITSADQGSDIESAVVQRYIFTADYLGATTEATTVEIAAHITGTVRWILSAMLGLPQLVSASVERPKVSASEISKPTMTKAGL